MEGIFFVTSFFENPSYDANRSTISVSEFQHEFAIISTPPRFSLPVIHHNIYYTILTTKSQLSHHEC